MEEVQEEVHQIKDEWEDEEVEENGGPKVEGEPHGYNRPPSVVNDQSVTK